MCSSDLTEGGETSSVIGTVMAALDQWKSEPGFDPEVSRKNLYFVYNNPDDRLLPFDGNDLPGVMSATGAHRLLGLWAVRPGQCALVVCDRAERARAEAERSANRRGQVGTGERSERIRTYNFPQGRVSDHRINLTLYKIDKVVAGEALDEFIDALIAEDRAARLSELP